MKTREFDSILRTVTTKATKDKPAKLDLAKTRNLPEDTKAAMVRHIARKRQAIVADLLGPGTDRAWLECCGYMYAFQGPEMRLLGLGQHALGRQQLPTDAAWEHVDAR